MTIFNVCCFQVYEEEDQLLWCPDVLSECKVKDYLSEALSQSTDDSTENSTSEHIRDNEQVCALQILSLINIMWKSFAHVRAAAMVLIAFFSLTSFLGLVWAFEM